MLEIIAVKSVNKTTALVIYNTDIIPVSTGRIIILSQLIMNKKLDR